VLDLTAEAAQGLPKAADGSEALLILQVAKMPREMSFARRQPIVIEREQVMGLSIPECAVFAEGEEFFYRVAFYCPQSNWSTYETLFPQWAATLVVQ
jgi:hypothetical protein